LAARRALPPARRFGAVPAGHLADNAAATEPTSTLLLALLSRIGDRLAVWLVAGEAASAGLGRACRPAGNDIPVPALEAGEAAAVLPDATFPFALALVAANRVWPAAVGPLADERWVAFTYAVRHALAVVQVGTRRALLAGLAAPLAIAQSQ